jgi:YfiH family protein
MISPASIAFDPEQQFYHFEILDLLKTVAHVVTTRNSFSIPDFNLSFHTGKEEQVVGNRNQLCQFFKARALTIPKQCHGIRIAEVTEHNKHEIPVDTDALITNVPGLAIGVLSADCVPLLFLDPVKQVIGAAHAGWKGTVAGIATATIEKMGIAYGSKPQDMIVCIGPSISQIHFEVGEEVADRFKELELHACIKQENGAKPHIDLWMANRLLLQKAGIAEANIHTAAICTVEHTDQFYSARGEGFGTGRFGAFMLLK